VAQGGVKKPKGRAAKPARREAPSSAGRLREPLDPSAEALSVSLTFDARLAEVDIEQSLAHAEMLERQGILSADDLAAIQGGMSQIREELRAGSFPFRRALEDIHMNVEARLTELVGDAGRRLHTGRSRNDQVATDLRLYLRGETRAIVKLIDELRAALLTVADRELDTILPGYTHLQRAQPVRLAHHLLAYFEMFSRDRARFSDALARMDECPLGAGALAGTSLPIDRRHTAKALGFRAPSTNSLDAVASRDHALEFLSAAAISMTHLSRFAEEIVLWATPEFGFIELPDAFSTGSSLMPQKKNPDVAELIRGKTGRVVGDLMTLLTVVKGLPLAYNRDLQEDKEPLFDACDTLRACLLATARMLPAIGFRRDRMRAATRAGFLTATDAAEYLVRRGVPFRAAHEAVGRMVRELVESGQELHELTSQDLRRFHEAFGEDAPGALEPAGAVDARDLEGGPARNRVAAALRAAHKRLAHDRR
jgi:argininosuccinate lyase